MIFWSDFNNERKQENNVRNVRRKFTKSKYTLN